jgi:NAD(P)-dependent dehydrogenase (short-subunit alcohol dehydrogenase family)
MQIANSVALVTGANRGIGRHFARQLIERGAAKVYATARNPESVDLPGVEVLRLDITDPASVAAAAAAASDVTLLVNNAGILTGQNLVTGDPAQIRLEMDTHFFGTLEVIRAFAPVLGANGGGAILNVLSALSWLSYDGANAYSAAKAAQWSLTNGVRLELKGQGTLVTGLHLASTDTDMTASLDGPKNDPADVVRAALDGIEAGRIEVLADQQVITLKAALSADPSALYPQVV